MPCQDVGQVPVGKGVVGREEALGAEILHGGDPALGAGSSDIVEECHEESPCHQDPRQPLGVDSGGGCLFHDRLCRRESGRLARAHQHRFKANRSPRDVGRREADRDQKVVHVLRKKRTGKGPALGVIPP